MNMARWFALITLVALGLVPPALPAQAQSDNERYSVIRPEPELAPKHKSRRGAGQRVTIPRYVPAPQPYTGVPAPIIAPRTGVALPNLPMPGSGPGGRETSQDRAVRCSHQAGVYGQAAGDRNAYVGTCINQ